MKLEDSRVYCKDWMCDSGQRSLDCYGGVGVRVYTVYQVRDGL